MRDEPVRCVCGRRAGVVEAPEWPKCPLFYVDCSRVPSCWSGPLCRSEAEAVRAWNRLMKRKGGGRDEVRDNRMRK